MYKGMVNSPETTITNNISNSDTLIYVLDPTRVPSELPNVMTLGTSSNAETVKVLSMDGSALTVERGFQGTPIAWNVGTIIARNFTEYDYEALRINVSNLGSTDENKGASLVKIHDADGNFTSDNVEGALKENAAGISEVNLSLSHRNLLDNPFFTVNQRGLTSYANGTGYCVDRWNRGNPYAVDVYDNYIQITSGVNNGFFTQKLENVFVKLPNKEVTASVIAEVVSGTAYLSIRDGSSKSVEIKTGLTTISKTIINSPTEDNITIYASPGAVIKLYAVKLELGSKSTLANDLPMDYGKELAVCQRYQHIPDTSTICEIGIGIAISTTSLRIPIKFPVRMRDLPVLSVAPSEFQVSDFSGAPIVLTGLSINSAQNGLDSTVLIATVASGLTQFRTYQLTPVTAGNKMIFSANL
jgi:hypothetical protein